MNGVTASLKFHEFDDFQDDRCELVLRSGENYATTDGIRDDSKHSLEFNYEEAKLEFHKTDKDHWKFHFGVLEEGDLTETSEFDLFTKIAKDMDAKIAILCPERCFKDYMMFKPDIADIHKRIYKYLVTDLHEDSDFGKQIWWMKSACTKYCIKFELELMRDFFGSAYDSMEDFFGSTEDCIDSFLRTMVETRDNKIRDFITKTCSYWSHWRSINDRQKQSDICKVIYDYLRRSLDFLKRKPSMMKTCIKTAYRLKSQSEGFPELVESIDAFLTEVGEPLVPLYDTKCIKCLHCKESDSESEESDSESEESDSESEESDSDYVDTSQSIADKCWANKYNQK